MAASTASFRRPHRGQLRISKRRNGVSRQETDHIRVACLALLAALLVPTGSMFAAGNDPNQKLPRFVSLRSDLVNLRVGPGENYPIEWVLTRKEMPVEIVREFAH